MALVYKDKGSLQERTKEDFEEITEDDNIITQIFERAKSSMGNDLSEVDEKNIREFADYILQHYDYKRNLQTYLKEQMSNVAPNLTTILGESVAARLLTHSGGLNNLAKLPASTIQILGAEKALFRALKTNLPSIKKTNFQLAIQDKTLATQLNELMKIKSLSGDNFNEIFRGIRTHLAAFLSSEDG